MWLYDGDGNPLSANAGLGTEETFTYDATNRMSGYTKATTSTSASYLYDRLARRLRKTVNGVTTWFLWDDDRLLAEFSSSGIRERRYTYTSGHSPTEEAVFDGSSETVYQVHADHLDTPRGMSDNSSTIVWRAAYRVFGETSPEEDPDGDLAGVSLAMRFPGQLADSESALYYNRHRYYSPGRGAYDSADPIGQRGGVNLYSYTLNNPVNTWDTLGLDPQWPYWPTDEGTFNDDKDRLKDEIDKVAPGGGEVVDKLEKSPFGSVACDLELSACMAKSASNGFENPSPADCERQANKCLCKAAGKENEPPSTQPEEAVGRESGSREAVDKYGRGRAKKVPSGKGQ